jgi:hypothetical protein
MEVLGMSRLLVPLAMVLLSWSVIVGIAFGTLKIYQWLSG